LPRVPLQGSWKRASTAKFEQMRQSAPLHLASEALRETSSPSLRMHVRPGRSPVRGKPQTLEGRSNRAPPRIMEILRIVFARERALEGGVPA
jgi:hypothetical protein